MSLLRDEAAIRRAFDAFDTDSSGYISVENLHTVFGAEYSGHPVEDMLLQAGCSNPKGLSWGEFRAAVYDSRSISRPSKDLASGASQANGSVP